ncbi:MAG: hypothetical protein JO093_03195 [Acidobacteria bacterium]|nr:hypothetical protein [Acidobacteriota bacterium]MBV9184594.1 hypothetical protein [Acidobacteriota bacterium]
MKTRALMAASALFLGIAGVAALFAPDEILRAAGIPSSPFLPPLVQLCAALLLGFAMTNWMTKGSRVGGIYNRPIAVGNLLNFAVGAITLDRFALRGHEAWPMLVFATVYTLFAVAFGLVVFGGGER